MPLKRLTKKLIPKKDRLEHQRLTSLVNSMADAVIAVDEDVRVVLYNAAALNTLDVNTIKAGTHLGKLFHPQDKNNHPTDVTKLVQAVKMPTASRDLRLKYQDGSLISLYLSIAPVRLGYGERGQHGYVLLIRDISREKSLEEERDEFISVVSHELRTPITIAEGNISNAKFIAAKSGDMAAINKALDEAHEQVLFLADMINDLSTLSRAERGKLKIEVEPIDVHELVSELVSSYQPEAKAKGLTITSKVDDNVGKLSSSRLYVQEILQNFITNAIKYTEKGSVTITAGLTTKGVCFKIKDSGIGISKSDQERVFDKFFRSEDYRTRKVNGTGLGLYVTVKLTRLVHAEMDLESELNHGSTFIIVIPNLQ
ncbi:MAG TPA: ATP-binding protein [Methylomirabilota bacterium]|nr:ATP-binding protein [Methylomirabilota bacterium]